ncbi:MAG: hypothetical protein P4L50_11535 [Anaerolineaceae bacterium]|nr:hypothetical protein [Anaerolineaceae bacterium]
MHKKAARLFAFTITISILLACQSVSSLSFPQTQVPAAVTATSGGTPSPTAAATNIPTPTAANTATPFPSATSLPVGFWTTGDFHSHTWLSDGKHPLTELLNAGFNQFGLDWMANSDHGGSFGHDPNGTAWDDPALIGKVKLLGDATTWKDGQKVKHPAMWRWQSLLDFSWPLVFGGQNGEGNNQPGLQSKYPNKVLIQGLEWNVPSHAHASVGIINQTSGAAISNFEYQFDASDKDTSRSAEFSKQNSTAADALSAVHYLAENYPSDSYVVINHPSREQTYTAADLRDLINAGPNIVLGLEGMPGHQKESARGSYSYNFFKDANSKIPDQQKNDQARTYGGADIMLAKVGGVMDSLWGEGRRFWVFDNSDFHGSASDGDFWPGEYEKNHVYVTELTQSSILNGMRSGNVFITHGDLINALDFKAASSGNSSTMGQELDSLKGSDVTVTIRFKSPDKNNNGDKPTVDHIDLIRGDMTGMIQPGSPNYASDTNSSTQVVATFTDKDWKTDSDGYQTITYILPKLQQNSYLRLRGTNLGMNVKNETEDGNPLIDELMGSNDQAKAYADLWFYSNPIFITIR